MFQYVLLAFVASAFAYESVRSGCPNIKPVENFDISTFGQGRWYEIAKYANRKEGRGICGYAQYTPRCDESFKIQNFDYNDGKIRQIDGVGKRFPTAGTDGIMTYTYPYGPQGSMAEFKVYIPSTDYKNYAIIYSCQWNEETQSLNEYSFIFSRSKFLSPKAKSYVDSFLSASPVLDKSRYVWNDFSLETCNAV